MIIGTVVTNSHLARAKVLAKSIKLHQPEIKVIVCLVERHLNPDLTDFQYFDEVVLAKDTWVGNDGEFDRILFKYEAWEACCFAKATLFDYIFNKYSEENHVLFLDSDMEVISPLEDLPHRFNRSSILLSPQHMYKGMEYDNFKYGVYNAGLIGVSRTPDGLGFIKWWKKRLERHSYFGDYDTLFAEQKWLNLVPSLFDGVEVIKHPGYNIAGWNFPERKISRTSNGKYTVNGETLYVFHYHSINWLEKEAQHPNFRSHNPDMAKLITQYAQKLNEMKRHSLELIPWSYNFFSDGSAISRESRLVYRNNLKLEKKHPYPFFMKNEDFIRYKNNEVDIEDLEPQKSTVRKKAIKAGKRRRLNRRSKKWIMKGKRRIRLLKPPLKARRRRIKKHVRAYYRKRRIRAKRLYLKKFRSRPKNRHVKVGRVKRKLRIHFLKSTLKISNANQHVPQNHNFKVGEEKLFASGEKDV